MGCLGGQLHYTHEIAPFLTTDNTDNADKTGSSQKSVDLIICAIRVICGSLPTQALLAWTAGRFISLLLKLPITFGKTEPAAPGLNLCQAGWFV